MPMYMHEKVDLLTYFTYNDFHVCESVFTYASNS